MDHVENIRIEEIVKIVCEFAKHSEEVVNKKKIQLRKIIIKYKVIKKNFTFYL